MGSSEIRKLGSFLSVFSYCFTIKVYKYEGNDLVLNGSFQSFLIASKPSILNYIDVPLFFVSTYFQSFLIASFLMLIIH